MQVFIKTSFPRSLSVVFPSHFNGLCAQWERECYYTDWLNEPGSTPGAVSEGNYKTWGCVHLFPTPNNNKKKESRKLKVKAKWGAKV